MQTQMIHVSHSHGSFKQLIFSEWYSKSAFDHQKQVLPPVLNRKCACCFSDAEACLWSCSWQCLATKGQGGRSRGEQSLMCIGTGHQDSPRRWFGRLEWSDRLPAKFEKRLQETKREKEIVFTLYFNMSCQVSLNSELILFIIAQPSQ